MEGMTGRIDEKRTRYQFDCSFRDISRDSEGKIQSLIVFNDRNEAYYESFTVFITRPVEKTIRIAESEVEEGENIGKINRPRRKHFTPQPQELNTKYRDH